MASRRDNYRRALKAEGASEEEIAQTLAEVEAEEAGKDRFARARRAGIPTLYHGVTFDDVESDPERAAAVEKARSWAWSKTRRTAGLYLWSDGAGDEDQTGFGTGKTQIAAACAQRLLLSLRVRWLDVVRLMTDLNLPFGNPQHDAAARRLQRPVAGELVVLDDIDKQPPTDRNIQPIFALINDCVGDRVPLIVTANRCLDDLAADYGDRFGHALASRLIGHCQDIEVRGRDRRLNP